MSLKIRNKEIHVEIYATLKCMKKINIFLGIIGLIAFLGLFIHFKKDDLVRIPSPTVTTEDKQVTEALAKSEQPPVKQSIKQEVEKNPATPTYKTKSFVTIKQDSGLGLRNPEKAENKVIQNKAEWETLWEQINIGRIPTPPLLEIDLSKYIILSASTGFHSSGGWSIKISKIEEYENKINVKVTINAPGKDCSVTTAITNPYTIISIEKTDKPINFNTETVATNCQ